MVNDRESELTDLHFGVPHGSNFGPVLFIYVADLISTIVTNCAQHADDTTMYTTSYPGSSSQRGNSARIKDPWYEVAIYKNYEVLNVKQCVSNINSTLEILSTWSTNINLALKHKKTKTMPFATSQENLHHKLWSLQDLKLNSLSIIYRYSAKPLTIFLALAFMST